MATVAGAYSSTEDLLKGDIPLQVQHGDGSGAVKSAADDIDAQIGHIYETPIEVEDTPANRPTRLLLKKINNLIASGRLMLDMAAAGEDDRINAYGMQMLKEGLSLLAQVQSGKITLTGATRLDEAAAAAGPSIHNEDEYSLVEQYYNPRLRASLSMFGIDSGPYSGNN